MKPETDDERSIAKRILGVITLSAASVVPWVGRVIIGRTITLDNIELIPTWLLIGDLMVLNALGGVLAAIAAFLNRRWLRYGSVALTFFYVFWLAAIAVRLIIKGDNP